MAPNLALYSKSQVTNHPGHLQISPGPTMQSRTVFSFKHRIRNLRAI